MSCADDSTSPTSQSQGYTKTHADNPPGLIPRATYYGRVGLELGKLIVNNRGMAPP